MNYLMIEGKKVELSDETVKNLKESLAELKEYKPTTGDILDFGRGGRQLVIPHKDGLDGYVTVDNNGRCLNGKFISLSDYIVEGTASLVGNVFNECNLRKY